MYEIYTYDSEDDYESSKYSFLDGCYKSMGDALTVVKSERLLDDYTVVKVAAVNDEEATVLRAEIK